MKLRMYLMVLFVFVTIISGLTGCRKTEAPLPPALPKVTVTTPVQREVVDYKDFKGTIEAIREVDLRARVEGFLAEVSFEDGSIVQEGDLLFTIEQDAYNIFLDQAKAQVEAAQADFDRATVEFERGQSAYDDNAISKEELTRRKAERDKAHGLLLGTQAQLHQAELNLSYTQIHAPITGKISEKAVDIDNLVGAGGEKTFLAKLVQMDPLYVYFEISETLLLEFLRERKGDTVSEKDGHPFFVRLADETEFEHEGMIDYADNVINTETGTIGIRGRINNPDMLMFPGMFVRVRVPGVPKPDSILVQEIALGTDLGGKYLLIVGEGNVVEKRPVKPGLLYGTERLILDGIKANETYIVKGLQKARPGLPVDPEMLTSTGGR